jgi:hypothetical protein
MVITAKSEFATVTQRSPRNAELGAVGTAES